MIGNKMSGNEFSDSWRPSKPKPKSEMTSGEMMAHIEWHNAMWARFKIERGRQCEKCGQRINQKTAVFHHKHYRTYLHETGDELVMLCGECHSDLHERAQVFELTEEDIPFVDPLWEQRIRGAKS